MKKLLLLEYISEDINTKFIEAVKKQIIHNEIPGKENFKRVFDEIGFKSIYIVTEQE